MRVRWPAFLLRNQELPLCFRRRYQKLRFYTFGESSAAQRPLPLPPAGTAEFCCSMLLGANRVPIPPWYAEVSPSSKYVGASATLAGRRCCCAAVVSASEAVGTLGRGNRGLQQVFQAIHHRGRRNPAVEMSLATDSCVLPVKRRALFRCAHDCPPWRRISFIFFQERVRLSPRYRRCRLSERSPRG